MLPEEAITPLFMPSSLKGRNVWLSQNELLELRQAAAFIVSADPGILKIRKSIFSIKNTLILNAGERVVLHAIMTWMMKQYGFDLDSIIQKLAD